MFEAKNVDGEIEIGPSAIDLIQADVQISVPGMCRHCSDVLYTGSDSQLKRRRTKPTNHRPDLARGIRAKALAVMAMRCRWEDAP